MYFFLYQTFNKKKFVYSSKGINLQTIILAFTLLAKDKTFTYSKYNKNRIKSHTDMKTYSILICRKEWNESKKKKNFRKLI